MVEVLVVQADDSARESLIGGLNRHGYGVCGVATGREALKTYEQAGLVLLDLELPDLDGIEVCRTIRAGDDTPVITLTGGGTELDRVLSLQAGADDCMAKPFGFRELLARIQAVQRRTRRDSPAARAIAHGHLQICPRSRQVRVGARAVELTRKEFDLLHLLASPPGQVFSRREIMAMIWDDTWAASSRTVDTHVSTLRSKLGSGKWIITVRGVGYRLGHAPDDPGDHVIPRGLTFS